jgi:hypothetical protein
MQPRTHEQYRHLARQINDWKMMHWAFPVTQGLVMTGQIKHRPNHVRQRPVNMIMRLFRPLMIQWVILVCHTRIFLLRSYNKPLLIYVLNIIYFYKKINIYYILKIGKHCHKKINIINILC